MSERDQSKIFAVRTTGGQERTVVNFVANKILVELRDENENKGRRRRPIYAILVLDVLKGYVFFEAPNAQVVGESVSGIKHVKSPISGVIRFQDIEKFLITKPAISEFDMDDTVEVIAGPFKGMRARINRIELTRSEVTVILLDAPYQLPVTIDANYLKLVEKAKARGS